MAQGKRLVCEVPLEGGRFLVLTLAYSHEFVKQHAMQPGRILTLDLPEIDFSGEAAILAVQDSPALGAREGELLVAMERCHQGDFGVMVFGQSELARAVMERRRERSREIVLVMEKPDGGRVDIRLIRFVNWLEAHEAEIGKEIFLDLPDVGVRGNVEVREIHPCPSLELPKPGPYRSQLVTGTFRHASGTVYDLKLEGEPQRIGVTPTHQFWSHD